MIKYQLNCKNCEKTFESWFASSIEFEKLKKLKLVTCSNCNSVKIEKSIMSPRISSTKNLNDKNKTQNSKLYELKFKIKEIQNYIKNNFENVGENFTYEARSIHYGEKKTKKGIYGKASYKDIKELKEEGIETTTFPWINDKEN